MDSYDYLLDIMTKYIAIDEMIIVKEKFAFKRTNIAEIKKALLVDGRIVFENERAVIADVKSGFLKLNHCYIATTISEDTLYIVASAEEGLIKQKTSKKAITRLIDRIQK